MDITTVVLHGLAACLPVSLFLAGLVVIDSFKLVAVRVVLVTIGIGILSAVASFYVNNVLMGATGLPPLTYSRYVAAAVEEPLKALWLVVLMRRHRIGFLVDAVILGFALGAGFALSENLYYLATRPETALPTWIIRGFGTAIMHGGTISIFAMVSKVLWDRSAKPGLQHFLPGLAIAYVLHSAYNHFLIPAVYLTAGMLIVFPLVIAVVFQKSEDLTRDWLGAGFDSDQELLEAIMTGQVHDTPTGRYLQVMKDRFPPEVIFDMLALLQLHVELSIRAKGILMMRQAGFAPEPDPAVRAQLEELNYLEKSIGHTGMLAIHPFLHTSSRDLWKINMLRQEA